MFRRFLCRLGIHGPEWGGHGLQNASAANSIVGPGHRRCSHCGAEWTAYEAVSNRPYRVLAWEQTKLANNQIIGGTSDESQS